MPDISALAAALSSLNAAKDIAQAMIGLRDTTAFQTKLLEFQSKLLDANRAAFEAQDERAALLEQIRALEEKVASFETWDAEKKRYELKEYGRGAFAYALKPEAQGTEPMHQICANCYQGRKKSILQIVPGNNARTALGISPVYRCPICKSEVAI
jgi:hypothetical protein